LINARCVWRIVLQAVGVKSAEQLDKVAKMARRAQRKANLMARQGCLNAAGAMLRRTGLK
jgi:hypothetical protein